MAQTRKSVKSTNKKKASRTSSASRLRKYLTILSISLVLVVIIFVGAFFAVIQLMPFDPSPLMSKSAAPTVVYAKDGSKYMTISSGASDLDFAHIPKNLQDAVVATEDHDFWKNRSSFDLKALLRSVFVDLLQQRKAQGGSTIPEQLAKIVYLTQKKTFTRKVQQIVLGMQINRYFTKQEILTMYLNKAYLGENCVGMEQAAKRYFGVDLKKNPNALTWPQAAMLAGLLQAPSAYDPLANPTLAKERRNQVLDNLVKYGYLTEKQAEQYKKAPIGATFHNIDNDGWDAHPLFTNFLYDYANHIGISSDELFSQGINIYTTIDPKVQKAIDAVFWDNLHPGDFPPDKGGKSVEGAAVFIDPKTGGILGGAGSRKADYARFGWDRIYAKSSPGSSIKPIMEYAPAIESGKFGPDSILNNTPHDFGGGYFPRNDDPSAPAQVTMRYALRTSQNVAAVWLLQHIGIQTGTSFAERDGIDLKPEQKTQLGVAIGGEDVYPLQMAQAYEAFDNQGVQMKAHLITRITNSAGEVLYQYKDEQKQIMSPHTAAVMTDLLHDVVQYGTGYKAQVPGWDVAGKTGTVQYDSSQSGWHRDWVSRVWFDGYTPNMVGSVYLGFDHTDSIHHLDWSPYPGEYVCKIFSDIVQMSVQGEPPQHFTNTVAQPGQSQTQQPTQPIVSNLTAMWDPNQYAVQLNWTSTRNDVYYLITRQEVVSPEDFRRRDSGTQQGSGGASQSTLISLGQTNLTQFTDTQVVPGRTYIYMVQAVDANSSNVIGQPVQVQCTVPTSSVPSTPPGQNQTNGTDFGNTTGNTDGGLGGVGNGSGGIDWGNTANTPSGGNVPNTGNLPTTGNSPTSGNSINQGNSNGLQTTH